MFKTISIALILLGGGLYAQELSGKWMGNFKAEGGDHGIPQLIVLKQSGSKLTGSGGPDDSEQYPIANGTVNGDKVHFELTTARSKFFYDLTKKGGNLNGELEIRSVNRVARATVDLKKAK
jgi:hypothetical protein